MTRVLSGAVLLLIAVAAVWAAPAVIFLAIAEVLVVLAAIEYGGLARRVGVRVPPIVPAAAAALTCAAFSRTIGAAHALDVVLMTATIAVSALAVASWRGGPEAMAAAAAAVFPALYLGLPIGAMVAIRETRGPAAVFLLMATVIVSDTAQYYTGRAFGRRKLAPAVSPKKTVEGAIGGFVFGSAALAWAGGWWLPDVPPAFRVALGLGVVALGIMGDLFESMLKRGADVKDSSTLIPGHGGVLDRIDALLFAAPIYYVVLKYL